MVLVTNVAVAMICCIYCCLCWGSWGNTQKLVQKKEWKSFLFYWDYILGFFLTAVLGLLLFNGGSIFDGITWEGVKWAVLGGIVWNVA
ncbi:MAG: multidrug DMT transporter permease, partial [Bacteroidales bacterium]|nr:multidrug DMT transporter permease [Bacteroidales bacterium]